MNHDFQEALSAIEGVERSEIEISENGPLSIRVGLARGADRLVVAEAVQRLLESRGLRSRVAPDRREPGPPQPPPPPPGPYGPGPSRRPASTPPDVILEDEEPARVDDAGIESVAVSEAGDGLEVTVLADGGRSSVRRARRSEQAMHEAIVGAVADLFDPGAGPPGLRSVEISGDYPALTVYLEDQTGELRVGASVIAAGVPFALAQAVWRALRR